MKKTIAGIVIIAFLLMACSVPQDNDTDTSKQTTTTLQKENSPPAQTTPETVPTTTSSTVPATTTTSTAAARETTPQESSENSKNTVKEFTVTAKNWEFSPATIEVKKGDTVRIIATSADVTHGLYIPEYNVKMTLKQGVPQTAEFVADKAGEFTFFCNIPCGAGHKDMKGKLVVRE